MHLNVIGDNTTYGFYATGHKIDCLYCHDVEKRHIDGEHRTYEVNETTWAATSYSDGYRLKGYGMMVPRSSASSIDPANFTLCLNCHNKDEVLGQNLRSGGQEPHQLLGQHAHNKLPSAMRTITI